MEENFGLADPTGSGYNKEQIEQRRVVRSPARHCENTKPTHRPRRYAGLCRRAESLG